MSDLNKKYEIAKDIVYELVTEGHVDTGRNITVYLRSDNYSVVENLPDNIHKAKLENGTTENYFTIEIDHKENFRGFNNTEWVRSMTEENIGSVIPSGSNIVDIVPE